MNEKGNNEAIYGEPMPPPSSWSFESQIEIYAIKKKILRFPLTKKKWLKSKCFAAILSVG